jgi:5'-nucleotidase
MGDVLTVLPFQNTVATFQLTGADVLAAIENGLSQIDAGAGRFPQVSGMKFSFDKTKPPGSRVVSAEVKEGNGFVLLDPKKVYGVVSNNYMRAGGDGYTVFANNGKKAYDFGPNLEQVVADYLTAHTPYKPYLDGRVTQVETAGSTVQPEAVQPTEKLIAPSGEKPAVAPAAPAPAPVTPPPPAAKNEAMKPAEPIKTPTTHVIAAGDTFWVLAKTFYGDAGLWRKLAAANRHMNPRHLPVGRELKVPGK